MLYVAGTIVALVALAFLINNIILFRNTIAQYVAQGYPYAEVFWGLFPGQLLPGLFQPIAVYGGIAALLYAAGMINHKVTQCVACCSQVEPMEGNEHANAVESEQTETVSE